MAKKPNNSIKTSTKLIRNLETPLMDSEKLARADELARTLAQLREHESTMANIKAGWKKISQELEAKVSFYGKIVGSGKESRAVECREDLNWEDKTVDCFRLDTGELVDTRPMYAHELQAEMALDGAEA